VAERAKRVPWDEALAFWLGMGPERSYGKVALKFGVSEPAVRKHAKQHEWSEHARRVDEQAALKAEHHGVRLRADRIADQVKVTDAARERYAYQLRNPANKVTGAEVAALARIEALIEGEATERIERSQLDAELDRWFEVAREFVPADRYEEFLDRLEAE
jgi:hypothetical protein